MSQTNCTPEKGRKSTPSLTRESKYFGCVLLVFWRYLLLEQIKKDLICSKRTSFGKPFICIARPNHCDESVDRASICIIFVYSSVSGERKKFTSHFVKRQSKLRQKTKTHSITRDKTCRADQTRPLFYNYN